MATVTEEHILSDSANCLYWGQHATEISDTLVTLQQAGSMVDVTLKAGDEAIKVHRMVLCASSPLLKNLLSTMDDPAPCIIMPETEMVDLKAIIDFVYRGEINFLISQLPSLLQVAELLGIKGLNEIISEIPRLQQEGEVVISDNAECAKPAETISLTLWESVIDEEDNNVVVEEVVLEDKIDSDNIHTNKKKKFREMQNREKKYSDEALEEALKDMKAGRPLCETASSYGIPRTTLYMRARSSGLLEPSHKLHYSSEQLQEAIESVKTGMSLQQASDRYSIPKTVLWRKVQAFRGEYNIRCHQNYSAADKQAAIEALERGEQLRVVAEQFAVPKTTLFREKVKLVEKGILPSCSIKRRSTVPDFIRNLRVEQAVAACKEGKMSQAAASIHFQVPKTTIWRHMQRETLRNRRRLQDNGQMKKEIVLQDNDNSPSLTEQHVLEDQESYSEEGSNLKFDADDGEFVSSSLIILSSDSLQHRSHLVETEESHEDDEVELDDELGNNKE